MRSLRYEKVLHSLDTVFISSYDVKDAKVMLLVCKGRLLIPRGA